MLKVMGNKSAISGRSSLFIHFFIYCVAFFPSAVNDLECLGWARHRSKPLTGFGPVGGTKCRKHPGGFEISILEVRRS